MALILTSAAASNKNRGKPSAFFGSPKNNSKTNPVFQALDTEITLITTHIRKRSNPNFVRPENEPCSRMADSIFNLWNRYEPKLPKAYYQKKLLEMGDYLMEMKEYRLALRQCYERYLLCFERIKFSEITDGSTLEKLFFPNGFDTDNSGLTFRALMGKSISMYQIVKLNDPKLQNKQSVDECLQILSFLRLIMQIVLPKEPLCWLIYNGSIHIYTISRHLMSLGHSAQVLEYVIWASICMESSIPLMSVKYLPWRSTLYTAVCQCYYDCKAGQHAEAFARRGLAKINELSQLEMMSNADENPQIMIAFRESTIKMAIMVYKRSVFETRRKPKGLLRPKTRTNYKDVINTAWPRTTSEKLMAEMFDGTAAQFLALLESLSDSNRRIILTSPPAQDNEPEVLDVFVELFMIGQELLAGGGGNKLPGPKAQSAIGAPPLSGVTTDASLMDLAIRGEDGIPISAAIKFVKLAYNYEHWEVFDSLVEPILSHLSLLNEEEYFWHEKALELLLAMEKLNSNKKHKKNAVITDELGEEGQLPPDPNTTSLPGTAMKSTGMHDDHINLADVLVSIVSGSFKKSEVEIDIIVDAALFLWNKCKTVFQKYQTGSVDNPRYLYKMDQPHKWMYLLDTVHQTLCWCGVSSVDPALTAEVVLRLAMFYESSAYLDTMDGDKTALKDSKTTLTDICPTEINHSRISILSPPGNISAKGQLLLTKSILELGLIDMSYARQTVGLNDGKSIADVCWVKSVLNDTSTLLPGELNPEVFQHQLNYEVSDIGEEINVDDLIPDSLKESATSVWNTVKDLHLELLLMYHRVCLKLAALKQEDISKSAMEKKKGGSSTVS
ncbi:cilia- and flagella-associated protein 54-like [Patella vulgata]|uniref:cilia- and flagella-associated protein 54-like n=1 Tax=Patella vulgata TaxID=6465 RepID=UPI0024A993CA|nr:cilia- and flagella-associated protein 54-like [Patella vulgata]